MNTKDEFIPLIGELNIVLAEDDQTDCLLFKEALEELPLSAQLTIVNDGQQLLSLLQEPDNKLPDVVFLDINMPKKNGFAALAAIKNNVQLQKIPVIVFSAANEHHIDEIKIRQVFKDAAHYYIRKPSQFSQLKKVLYKALSIISEKNMALPKQENFVLIDKIELAENYDTSLLDETATPLLLLDANIKVKTASKSFCKTFHLREQEIEGIFIGNLDNNQWNIPELIDFLRRIITEKYTLNNFELIYSKLNVGELTLLVSAKQIIDINSFEKLILLSVENITKQKKSGDDEQKSVNDFKDADIQNPTTIYIEEKNKLENELATIRLKLLQTKKELSLQIKKEEKRAAELIIANKELVFQNEEKEKRAAELIIANKELVFQSAEKEKRAAELVIADKELIFQSIEKEKRASELIIAVKELIFQNEEKEKRAAELILANKEFIFQSQEKEKRAAELTVANNELIFQNEEKEKRAAELIIANKELIFQNGEKEKRAAELIVANKARSLIEAATDPLVTISAEGKITDVNEASVKVTGVSRENLIGTDFSNYFTEPEKAREVYKKVFDELVVYNYPLSILHINGKVTDVLYNASVYKDDAGKVLGVFAAARDVTQQKAAEEKIRQSEKMFKSIFDKSLAAVLVADDKGNYLSANKAAGDLLGYSVNELLQMNVGDLKTTVKPDAAKRFEEYIRKGEETGEIDFITKNGTHKFAQYQASRITTDFNLSILMDITAQKQASQYARSLIEASLDPLVTISPEGKITDVNEASIKVTGVLREKLIGTDFSDYFTEPEKARQGYKKVFEKGFVSDYPLTIRHKNGKLTDVLYNASVYKDDDENVLGVFAAARDVTAQKAEELSIANKELIVQNKEKEKRAAELEFANKELIFQNEEKEKRAAELISINKELEAFAYISSHDLQEPLRKIQIFSGIISEREQDKLSDKGKKYFRLIEDAANRMQTLIEDLLTFSRLSKEERKFEATNITGIVEEIKVEFRDVIEEKHATIEITEQCSVNIIVFQFHQLLHNLIGNALKFSNPNHAPHIVIKSCIVDNAELKNPKLIANKTYCHITVTDNGIGFEPIYSEKIFEVFQKLHGKEEYSGTGIGLAIVKKIVENHNGIIIATGELHKGTIFDIYIPNN